jgi:tetratricopeptide (TPR) repeat protein
MKKYMFFLLAGVILQTAVFAQSEKYLKAMKTNLAMFDSAKTVEDYTKLANTFERIGDAEKTQWLPYYYAGLALSTSGWMPAVTDKDANAGRMNAFCDKAEAIATADGDKAEILSIRNMSATQQMMVDPPARWMSYGQAAGQALEKALKLDPNNPRLYYLRGMSLFGTPEQFGGGKDKAKPVFEKAVQLYKEQKPKEFYPDWGKKQAEDMLAQCQ